jgi:hypothetical protein
VFFVVVLLGRRWRQQFCHLPLWWWYCDESDGGRFVFCFVLFFLGPFDFVH